MDIERRLDLIKQVGEEILTEEELKSLLETKAHPIAYDGFEPSGKLHIAQGIMRAINVNKMIEAGCKFKFWVADWFGWMNNKFGGDLEKIQTVGKYQIEVWKASGMKTKEIEFLWTSKVIAENPEYWKRTINIARANSVARIIRCAQIMGRSETENLSAAQIFYPCMQASDIFELGADITQLGMDQRKVNILARETGPKLGLWKPVVVSHHMLMGLLRPNESVSKESIENTRKLFEKIFSSVESVQQVLDIMGDMFNKESKDIDVSPIIDMRRASVKDWKKDLIESKKTFDTSPDATTNFIYHKLIELSKKIDNLHGRLYQLTVSKKTPTIDSLTSWREEFHSISKEITELLYGSMEKVREHMIAMKMSKSIPDSAIFMDDSAEEIKRKISKAFCPEKIVEENPILEYCKFLIFEKFQNVEINRPQKFGGNISIENFTELAKIYSEGKLHPMDLKNAVAEYIDKMVAPVRKHFESGSPKKLLEQVRGFEVTR